jgi:hypothetical protein
MKASSQRVRRNIIEKFFRETDANGQRNADKRAALLQREHIVRFMAARAVKPESANGTDPSQNVSLREPARNTPARNAI